MNITNEFHVPKRVWNKWPELYKWTYNEYRVAASDKIQHLWRTGRLHDKALSLNTDAVILALGLAFVEALDKEFVTLGIKK